MARRCRVTGPMGPSRRNTHVERIAEVCAETLEARRLLSLSPLGTYEGDTGVHSWTDPLPDARRGVTYVVDARDAWVKIIDPSTAQTLGQIDTPMVPSHLGLSADGQRLFAASENRVAVIDLGTKTVQKTAELTGWMGYGLAVGRGNTVFTSMVMTDLDTGNITYFAPTHYASQLGITPDRRTLVAVEIGSWNNAYTYDLTGPSPRALNQRQPAVLGNYGNYMAMSASGRFYAFEQGSQDSITIRDTATNAEVASVAAVPYGMAFSPDDAVLYVLTATEVIAVDTHDGTILGRFNVEWGGSGLAVDPSGEHLMVAGWIYSTGRHADAAPLAIQADFAYTLREGGTIHLDASYSHDPNGDALEYGWDLNGDGAFDDASGAKVDLSWADVPRLGANVLSSGTDIRVKVTAADGKSAVSLPSRLIGVGAATPLVTHSGDYPTYGQTVTLTATLAATTPVPTGVITWRNGDTVLGTSVIDAQGNSSISLALDAGRYSITGEYSGDMTYGPSVSPIHEFEVQKASSWLELNLDVGPNAFWGVAGWPVTATALFKTTLAAVPVGETITFLIDLEPVGTAVIDADGYARASIVFPEPGGYFFTAQYDGDSNFLAGTDGGYQRTTIIAPPQVSLAVWPLSPSVQDALTLMATVMHGNPPYGTVRFFGGAVLITSVRLDGESMASASLPPQSPGLHQYRATYVRDGSDIQTSATFDVTILTNRAPTAIALSGVSVAENQLLGTVVGTLSTTDPDLGDTFAYSLISGAGSEDNASFAISGGQVISSRRFDYEAKQSYSVRVCVTDSGGLSYEKPFAITVTDDADDLRGTFGLVNATKVTLPPLLDGDGDLVTFKLSGGGMGQVYGFDNSFEDIILSGTGPKSVLRIKVKKNKEGGDGLVRLGNISSDGLIKSINGSVAMLSGLVQINTLKQFSGKATVSLKLRQISEADIQVHGLAVSSITVSGDVANSRIVTTQSIGKFSAATLLNSDILVGVATSFAGDFASGAGDFANNTATLGSLKVSGRKLPKGSSHPAYVAGSHISVPTVGTVTLVNVADGAGAVVHVLTDTGTLKVNQSKATSTAMFAPGTWKLPGIRPPIWEAVTWS